jgi:hydroxypyruvate isomerase
MSGIDRRRFFQSTSVLAGASVLSASLGGGSRAAAEEADTAATAQDPSTLGKTPKTRFAVNVEMWWRKLPFLERIQQAAALGFPAVEFWPWQGKDLDAVARLSKERNIEIAQFTAWGFRPGLNDPKNHDKFLKAVEKGCEVAKQLDCKLMTVVGGDDQPDMSQEEMHDHIIAGLKRAAPIAAAEGITMILEPMNIRVDHKGHCLYGSPPTLKICDAVDSPYVKINWDLYHMQITEGDLCGRLRDGFRHVGYLQLADHPGRTEPGTGEVHYNRVLKEAYDLGYRGYVGLECRPETTELVAAQGVAAADIW